MGIIDKTNIQFIVYLLQARFNELLHWLKTTPKYTTIRVNTLLSSSERLVNHLNNLIEQPNVVCEYPKLPELITLSRQNSRQQLEAIDKLNEAIVDTACGTAVLRGAHVFAPGVLGLMSAAKIGDLINIYADIACNCKKGLPRRYVNSGKIFLGIGLLEQSREEIFLDGAKGTGIAIKMTKTITGLPQVGDACLQGIGLLQNLPSIVCARILDPQAGEIILDMCAAPGNKTTHMSALMQNQGTLIAVEKIKSKINKLVKHCELFGCSNVRVFCYDSTKSVAANDNGLEEIHQPPFTRELFDRILLDGPCSVLGKRPQLLNKIRASELRSFVALQRKLFTAVSINNLIVLY